MVTKFVLIQMGILPDVVKFRDGVDCIVGIFAFVTGGPDKTVQTIPELQPKYYKVFTRV